MGKSHSAGPYATTAMFPRLLKQIIQENHLLEQVQKHNVCSAVLLKADACTNYISSTKCTDLNLLFFS